jgi:predicted RNA-binding protein YlqC (UPF0109 family)
MGYCLRTKESGMKDLILMIAKSSLIDKSDEVEVVEIKCSKTKVLRPS